MGGLIDHTYVRDGSYFWLLTHDDHDALPQLETRCKLVLQANQFLFQSMCGHISILLERNP